MYFHQIQYLVQMESPQFYFKNDKEWQRWLHDNHGSSKGIQLIFYKIDHEMPSMRWEEAVRVALCYGWIDSTVKSLGDGKRQQYFCPRKPKSVWSKVNKNHLIDLESKGLIHESGYKAIAIAKENGSWTALDAVENGIIPVDYKRPLQKIKKHSRTTKLLQKDNEKAIYTG